jgi:hypothetical protein
VTIAGDVTIASDVADNGDVTDTGDVADVGDVTDTGDVADTGVPGVSDAAPDCALHHPPPPPDRTDAAVLRNLASPGTMDLVFAVASTEFGSEPTDAGPPSYPTIGFDLDNTCTGMGSCIEPVWAEGGLHHDGVDGIDNAYGEIIQGVYPETVDSTVDTADVLLRIFNYSGVPDEDPVDVALYLGLGVTPRDDGGVGLVWDGKDRWTILPDFLVNPDAGVASAYQPRFRADRAYVTGGVLVAQFDKTLWSAFVYNVPRLLVTARQLEFAGKLTQVGDAGANWELQDLVVGLRLPLADSMVGLALTPTQLDDGGVGPLYCQDTASYQAAKPLICGGADITADPTAPRSALCDAISIGLLFQAKQALLGDVAGPAPPLPVCSPDVHFGMDTCDSLGDQ